MVEKRKTKRKRTEFVAFYVTKEEKEKIASLAEENDQTISDYCRKTLIRRNAEE